MRRFKSSLSGMRCRRAVMFTAALAFMLLLKSPVGANHVTGGGKSFLFLQPGFTQDIFGVSQTFMGGVAFAPDGDPWVDQCTNGSPLHRYDAQSSPEVQSISPATTSSSVLLPQPEGPTIATNSPGRTARSTGPRA